MPTASSRRPDDIPTLVKNPRRVMRRRHQIVQAAVDLFIANGFHGTTTRDIARAAGVSCGLLYEYIAAKEDILYLVCETIHAEVDRTLEAALQRCRAPDDDPRDVLRDYFHVCHRLRHHILLIYQETPRLPPRWRRRVQENDVHLSGRFMQVLARLQAAGRLPDMDDRSLELTAHNISVLGHMWALRRFFLARHFSLEEYIERQVDLLLGSPGTAGRPAGRG